MANFVLYYDGSYWFEKRARDIFDALEGINDHKFILKVTGMKYWKLLQFLEETSPVCYSVEGSGFAYITNLTYAEGILGSAFQELLEEAQLK